MVYSTIVLELEKEGIGTPIASKQKEELARTASQRL
jgi:hypothetical protein